MADFGWGAISEQLGLANKAIGLATESTKELAGRALTGLGGVSDSVRGKLAEYASPQTRPTEIPKTQQVNVDTNASGPLRDLDPSEKEFFSFEQLQYPIGDLLERYPYYMTFHFNVTTTKSKFNSSYRGVTNDESGNLLDSFAGATSSASTGRTAREENRARGGSAQPPSVELKKDTKIFDITRQTLRTSHSIRLYMPDTLQWNFSQEWRDPHLSDSGLVNRLAPLAAIVEGVKSGSMDGTLTGFKQAFKIAAEKIGSTVTGAPEGVILSSLGYTVNPLIDVIYTSPNLRTFTMEFNFAPRSAQESIEVQKIIRAFKYFSAPEVPEVSGFGYLMIPPGDIDIEFSVASLGKISSCILRNIDLDYAPNGFAAYQNPQNITDGMPVNIRMRLEFTETEYITKDLILRGY